MKKKFICVIVIMVLIIAAIFICLVNNRYSKSENMFSKKYNVIKDNDVTYITKYNDLLKSIKDRDSVIFIGNNSDKSKKIAKKLVELSKDYNISLYYYDSSEFEELQDMLRVKKITYPTTVFIKDGQVNEVYTYSNDFEDKLDSMFNNLLSAVCGINTKC